MQGILSIWLQHRWLRHLAFWTVSYYVLLHHFAISSSLKPIDYLYAGLFHLPLLLTVYLNVLWLLPAFFRPGRYLGYFILWVLAIGLGMLLHVFLFDFLAPWVFPDFYIISYYEFGQLALYFVVYLGLSSLFHLSQSWFRLVESERQLDKLEKARYLSELEALRAQLNPHFLFNSLNSLYALALRQSEKTPQAILTLAEVLRYVVYDAKSEEVDLEKEIHFLEHYLALQALRLNEGQELKLKTEGDPTGRKVAPLLYIIFLENAFKHGNKDGTFHILLKVHPDQTSFTIRNELGLQDPSAPAQPGGLGLENVRRRLSLIYPERHHLHIEKSETHFQVNLSIEDLLISQN